MKNSYKQVFASVLLFCTTTISTAVTIEGVDVAEQVTQSDSKQVLLLNGAGVRSKFVFSIYVGALYLPARKTSVNEILAFTGPNRISMHFLYDEVTKEKLTSGWTEGFEENNTPIQLQKLQDRLNRFNQFFKNVVKGDVIILDYLPGKGTSVSMNGQQLGHIPGHDFNQALLKVWLGEVPADSDLKSAMLGVKVE